MTRTMVETAASEAELNGHISPAVRQSIHNVSGHNDQVSREFYELQNKQRDVTLCRELFSLDPQVLSDIGVQRMINSSRNNDIMEIAAISDELYTGEHGYGNEYEEEEAGGVNSSSLYHTNDSNSSDSPHTASSSVVLVQWGIRHPSFGSNSQRIKWSDTEVEYIATKVAELKRTGEYCHDRRFKQILHIIMEDDCAIPIFHSKHIQNSTSLSYGFESYERRARVVYNL